MILYLLLWTPKKFEFVDASVSLPELYLVSRQVTSPYKVALKKKN